MLKGEIKSCRINDLEESGDYSEDLIECLKKQQYDQIELYLTSDELNKWDVMAPIVYAVRNDFGTFLPYLYSGEKVQTNPTLFEDVVTNEIDLIDKSSVKDNRDFIKQNIDKHPELILHMSKSLQTDTLFLMECATQNKNVMPHIESIMQDNPNLVQDAKFVEKVKEIEKKYDGVELLNQLKISSAEQKNDNSFIKEVCKESDEAIEYIANNTSEFGQEGLNAAKEVLIDKSTEKAIEDFRKRAEEVATAIEQARQEGKTEEEIKDLVLEQRRLERHARLFEKMKNGGIDAARVARKIDKLCTNINEDYKKQNHQLITIDEAIKERGKEEIKEISTQEIGKKTIDTPTSDKDKATQIEEQTKQREEQSIKTPKELN